MTALLAGAHGPLVLLAAGVLLDNPWPRLHQVRHRPLWQTCVVDGPARGHSVSEKCLER